MFFMIDGVPYEIVALNELERERGGQAVRTYNGIERSMIRWEKRIFEAILYDLEESPAYTLADILSFGQQRYISGEAISGGPLLCTFRITGQPYIRIRGGGFVRGTSMVIRQV